MSDSGGCRWIAPEKVALMNARIPLQAQIKHDLWLVLDPTQSENAKGDQTKVGCEMRPSSFVFRS